MEINTDNLKVYKYNNKERTFSLNGELMINASEMAKSFPNKRINDFTSSKKTLELIRVLQSKTEYPIMVVKQGGDLRGTWMYKKLALKFAGWLSLEFELWVYDRIEEVLNGSNKLKTKYPKDFNYNLFLEANNLSKSNQEVQTELYQILSGISTLIELTLELRNDPKIDFCIEKVTSNHAKQVIKKQVTKNRSLITVSDIGKSLSPPISAVELNNFLREEGVQYKVGETWMLTDLYINRGLAELTDYPIYINGEECGRTDPFLKWTKKGLEFITTLYNKTNANRSCLKSLKRKIVSKREIASL